MPDQKFNFVTCAFINSETKPVKKGKFTGFFVSETHDKHETLCLHGSRDYFYPHPDAPEDALLHVYTTEHIASAGKTDKEYPILYMILNSQKLALQLCEEKGMV